MSIEDPNDVPEVWRPHFAAQRIEFMLAADPTLTQMSIARSFNRGQAWTYTRLRRYPPADAENGPA